MKRIGLTITLLLFVILTSSAQESLKAMRSTVIEKIDGKEYYIHTIKRGQTLYMISKAYGVDVNEVIKENPEVKEGIKADQKIRIPTHRPVEQAPPKKTPKPPVQEQKPPVVEVPPPAPEPVVELPCGEDKEALRPSYNVALMLPLYLGDVNKLDTMVVTTDQENSPRSLQFIQFYEGFRMAVDSLSRAGTPIRLSVYDVTKDTLLTRKILKSPEMKKMDLIIGVLYHKNFQMVAAFAEKNNIPLVNPVSEREQIVAGNPMVFKVVPSSHTIIAELFDQISRKFPNDNIIISREAKYKDTEGPETLKQLCLEKSMSVKSMVGYGGAFGVFSKEKENVIVAFSETKVYNIELLTKFNEFRNDYRLTLVGVPRWDKMEGLEPEYLVNLKAHFMAPTFIDYDDPVTKQFVYSYQERYKTDPELLAFQGYDIANYFLTALRTYGKAMDHCIPNFRMKSLQTDFHFATTKGNGYENQHWEFFYYENFKMKRLK